MQKFNLLQISAVIGTMVWACIFLGQPGQGLADSNVLGVCTVKANLPPPSSYCFPKGSCDYMQGVGNWGACPDKQVCCNDSGRQDTPSYYARCVPAENCIIDVIGAGPSTKSVRLQTERKASNATKGGTRSTTGLSR